MRFPARRRSIQRRPTTRSRSSLTLAPTAQPPVHRPITSMTSTTVRARVADRVAVRLPTWTSRPARRHLTISEAVSQLLSPIPTRAASTPVRWLPRCRSSLARCSVAVPSTWAAPSHWRTAIRTRCWSARSVLFRLLSSSSRRATSVWRTTAAAVTGNCCSLTLLVSVAT